MGKNLYNTWYTGLCNKIIKRCKDPLLKVVDLSRTPVAYIYIPSYLGGRDQEDHGLNLVLAGSLQDPISTNSWVQWHVPVISMTGEP
jgi:hypothetical protein